jgi:hypothetical protein
MVVCDLNNKYVKLNLLFSMFSMINGVGKGLKIPVELDFFDSPQLEIKKNKNKNFRIVSKLN